MRKKKHYKTLTNCNHNRQSRLQPFQTEAVVHQFTKSPIVVEIDFILIEGKSRRLVQLYSNYKPNKTSSSGSQVRVPLYFLFLLESTWLQLMYYLDTKTIQSKVKNVEMVLSSLGHFDDLCESGTLFWYLAINLFSLCSINNCYCASHHLRWKGERATNSNEEGKNCCNCHSYLLYLHCTGFSPMQNSQENQQQHNMQILGCVMLVELRVFKHYI